MRRAAIRTALARTVSPQVGGMAGRGLQAGVQAAENVGAAASEVLRVRRDPSAAAVRKRTAARRRTEVWGVGTGLGLAGTAGAVIGLVDSGASATLIFYLVLALAMLAYCGTGLVRAARDLRVRSRRVTALPPPQPARRVPPRGLGAEMQRLGRYSDSLRQMVVLVGVIEDESVRSLRRDVLTAADRVETELRQAAERLTGVQRGRRGNPGDAAGLDVTIAGLTSTIRSGVDQYGELVSAAGESVAATQAWQDTRDPGLPASNQALSNQALSNQAQSNQVPDRGLVEITDRLRGLAAGMRELAAGPAAG